MEVVCPGRERVNKPGAKWYLKSGLLSTQYTCCESCYLKYIKGTIEENKYTETTNLNFCNCDYLLYKTDCDFADCSVVDKNIRISITDEFGRRLNNNGSEFYVYPNTKLYLLIENLNEDTNSFLEIKDILINHKNYDIDQKKNYIKYLCEILLPKEKEWDKTIINLKICLTNKIDTMNLFKLKQLPDGSMVDPFGKQWLKFAAYNPNYRTFLDVSLYECLPENELEFTIILIEKLLDNHTEQIVDIVI